MKFDEMIDSIGWRASIGWMWEAVLRSRFFFFFLLVASAALIMEGKRIFGCGGYTPVLRGVFSLLFRAPVPDVGRLMFLNRDGCLSGGCMIGICNTYYVSYLFSFFPL